jgi:hypothetical protein
VQRRDAKFINGPLTLSAAEHPIFYSASALNQLNTRPGSGLIYVEPIGGQRQFLVARGREGIHKAVRAGGDGRSQGVIIRCLFAMDQNIHFLGTHFIICYRHPFAT